MPVTKRANGSYQVTVGFGGRTYRKTSRHWTFQDAKRYESDLTRQVRQAAAGVQPERLILDAVERWTAEHAPRHAEPHKSLSHSRSLGTVLDMPLSEIPQAWATLKTDLAGKSPATINHAGRVLRQIGNLAAKEWGWLDRQPHIRLLTETPRERFLTLAEVEALARACPRHECGEYVLLAAYTGIRRGHLLRLTHHDVADGWITLDRSGKSRRLHRVPVHPRVAEIAGRLPLGISEMMLRKDWKEARAKVGIECRWHDLRHTCASWLVQAGVPLYTVSQILGHSSIAVTQRYAHLNPANLMDAVLKLA